jgi:predicted Zn-dependent peptidase
MIQKSVLDNGIRVVSEKIPAVRSAAVGIWIETGARHEIPRVSGISHFVEHMLFKGTQTRDARAIAKTIDSVGGVLNGFTSREYTCYYAKVLGEKLPLAIDLLADMVQNSIFDPEELEKERRVILQEIGMVEDSPDELSYNLFNQTFWQDHPLGNSITGTAASIESLTRDDLCTFVRDRYCGEGIVVVAAGNVDHRQVVELITAAFGTITTPTLPEVSPLLPDYGRHLHLHEKDLEQAHICLGTRLLPQDHPNRFAAYLLNMILGGGMSSRLFQSIRENLGLAYSIYSSVDAHSDAGALVVYAAVAPTDTRQTVDEILKELARFRAQPILPEELAVAKDQLQGNILLSLESSDTCMSLLARNEIYLGRIFPIRELQRGIEKVTVEDIHRLAEFVIRDEYLNLQILGRVQSQGFDLSQLTVEGR